MLQIFIFVLQLQVMAWFKNIMEGKMVIETTAYRFSTPMASIAPKTPTTPSYFPE